MPDLATESEFDQLLDEFLARQRRGESPSLEQYLQEHPRWAEQIQRIFPALAALEDLGAKLAPTLHDQRDIPKQLGEYRIIREVGRGGMGVVYEAVQESLSRHVALKVLNQSIHTTPVSLQRFLREAQTAARLHHTNIVPVFGVGADKGTYFYAMQFIQGHGLDVVLNDIRQLRGSTVQDMAAPTVAESSAALITDVKNTSSIVRLDQRSYFRNIAKLMLQAAEALSYAHSQGVLHRDIKPSNLMLDANNTLWITDFGLAKSEGSDDLSRTGDLVGTLRYMAPERINGQSAPLSDIYSLGVTLYEMLALQPAFDEADRPALLEAITRGKCTPLRTIDPNIPRDLATIVQKAMSLEPRHRYQHAQDLAHDMRNWLEDRSILAREPSIPELAWKWMYRNPAWALLASLLLVGLVSTSLLSIYAWRKASQAQEANLRKDQALQEAIHAKDTANTEKQIALSVRLFLQNDLLRQADARGRAESMLGNQFRSVVTDNPTIVQLLDRASAQLAPDKIDSKFPHQPIVQAEILKTVGDAYRGISRFPESIALLERALRLFEQHTGELSPETLDTMNNLSLSYSAQGKQVQAEALLQKLLPRREQVSGSEHTETLTVMNNLAMCLHEMGKTSSAIAILEKIHRLESQPGHEAGDYTMSNLGLLYLTVGRLTEALPLLNQSLVQLQKKFGPRHPSTLMVQNTLAVAYQDSDRIPEAIALFEAVVKQQTQIHGLYHRETQTTVNNLAVAYSRAGRLPEALKLLESCHQAMVTQLGDEHLDTLSIKHNLACLYDEAGQYSQALGLLKKVHQLRITKLGANHTDTLLTLSNIGSLYWRMHDYQSAINLFEDLLTRYQKHQDEHHPDTIRAAINLAVNYQAAGRLEDAARILEKWLPIARKVPVCTMHALRIALVIEEARKGKQIESLKAEIKTLESVRK